jgi:plasmid replication initiation protein
MSKLFSNLKDGDKETFERDFRDAEANLRKAILKLRQLEDYIRESETKFVPFWKRYSSELKYIEETGTFTGRFCPSLNSILDKEEKNF